MQSACDETSYYYFGEMKIIKKKQFQNWKKVNWNHRYLYWKYYKV